MQPETRSHLFVNWTIDTYIMKSCSLLGFGLRNKLMNETKQIMHLNVEQFIGSLASVSLVSEITFTMQLAKKTPYTLL